MRLPPVAVAPLALALIFAFAAPAALAAVVNASFEAPVASGTLNDGRYCYLGSSSPTIGCNTVGLTATTFGWDGNAAVIRADSTAWGNPAGLGGYSYGSQLVGIQNTTFIEQVLELEEGSYTLTWADAGRAGYDPARYQVLVGGTSLGNFGTVAGEPWGVNSLAFSAVGPVALRFQGIATSRDGTAFIDGVTLTQNVPEPSALALASVALAGLAFGRRRRA